MYPALRIANYLLYSITLSNMVYVTLTLLCLGVVVTILLLQPYKKPYALHNKLDAVTIILIIVFNTCIIEPATDRRQITGKVSMVVADVATIVPFDYFTVKFLQLLKHVEPLRHVCLWCHICHDPNRIHHRDCNDTEKPLISVEWLSHAQIKHVTTLLYFAECMICLNNKST